jgi:glucose/mannose transport system permease protein
MVSITTEAAGAEETLPTLRNRLGAFLPFAVLAPSLLATFVYVFGFAAWTFYISLSDSSQLPSYGFVGFEHYTALWHNRRWGIAYNNLFLFSGFYVVLSMAVGLMLAI